MKFIWLALLSGLSANALAAETLPQLQRFDRLEGQFEQQRQLQILALPLKSNGVFIYQADQGLIWRTVQPVENRVEISAEEGVLAGSDENSLQQVPASELLAEIFLAVFAGDLQALQPLFEVDSQSADTGSEWQLLLTPKSQALQQYIANIELQGGEQLQQIKLQEANGDSTVISLQVTEAQ